MQVNKVIKPRPWMQGRKATMEHRNNIRNGIINYWKNNRRTVTEKQKEKIRKAMTGRKCSEETKRKMSLALGGDGDISNPMRLRKRARRSTGYKKWRYSVLERDSFTCRNCGIRGIKLIAHHILQFSKFRQFKFDLWNGLTVCEPCHKNIHNTKLTRPIQARLPAKIVV